MYLTMKDVQIVSFRVVLYCCSVDNVNKACILLVFVGSSLEQIHIFALAHILRRPIIVYGIKFVKNFRGENIGIARFQGRSAVILY